MDPDPYDMHLNKWFLSFWLTGFVLAMIAIAFWSGNLYMDRIEQAKVDQFNKSAERIASTASALPAWHIGHWVSEFRKLDAEHPDMDQTPRYQAMGVKREMVRDLLVRMHELDDRIPPSVASRSLQSASNHADLREWIQLAEMTLDRVDEGLEMTRRDELSFYHAREIFEAARSLRSIETELRRNGMEVPDMTGAQEATRRASSRSAGEHLVSIGVAASFTADEESLHFNWTEGEDGFDPSLRDWMLNRVQRELDPIEVRASPPGDA